MRLFIAVNFEREIKNILYNAVCELRTDSVWGNFTKPENLHLTLVFIGETPPAKISQIIEAIDKCFVDPIKIEFDKSGTFRRDSGDIYWIGIKKNPLLCDLHYQLSEQLKSLGFKIDNREFTPHITLGRQVVTNKNFRRDFSDVSACIKSVHLMKSERINGRLIYSSVYEKKIDDF